MGDVNNIICRSSWERFLCSNLDTNDEVKFWASEETVVRYLSPVDKEYRRYFVDFTVQFKNGKTVLIEVKPFHETQMPQPPSGRKTRKAVKRYEDAMNKFMINQAKWAAATQVAQSYGAAFQVFTEHELRKLGAPF
jgi:uncharacterized SAM-dependent methyltransferase